MEKQYTRKQPANPLDMPSNSQNGERYKRKKLRRIKEITGAKEMTPKVHIYVRCNEQWSGVRSVGSDLLSYNVAVIKKLI